jgi:hypothetical protein
MGVRITLFAIDLARLTSLFERSVWDWLWHYVDHGSPAGDPARIATSSHSMFYFARPGAGVTLSVDGKKTKLDRLHKPGDSVLSTPLGVYLATSIYELEAFVIAVSQCPSADVASVILRGSRRWWIGSLLECAERTLGPHDSDYIYLAGLFQRLLQGHNCGKELPKDAGASTGVRLPLPVRPDPDLRLGMWTAEETQLATAIIRSLEEWKPIYAAPPGPVGIPSASETDWNVWVRGMVGQLLVVDSFPGSMRNVLSFIC